MLHQEISFFAKYEYPKNRSTYLPKIKSFLLPLRSDFKTYIFNYGK